MRSLRPFVVFPTMMLDRVLHGFRKPWFVPTIPFLSHLPILFSWVYWVLLKKTCMTNVGVFSFSIFANGVTGKLCFRASTAATQKG